MSDAPAPAPAPAPPAPPAAPAAPAPSAGGAGGGGGGGLEVRRQAVMDAALRAALPPDVSADEAQEEIARRTLLAAAAGAGGARAGPGVGTELAAMAAAGRKAHINSLLQQKKGELVAPTAARKPAVPQPDGYFAVVNLANRGDQVRNYAPAMRVLGIFKNQTLALMHQRRVEAHPENRTRADVVHCRHFWVLPYSRERREKQAVQLARKARRQLDRLVEYIKYRRREFEERRMKPTEAVVGGSKYALHMRRKEMLEHERAEIRDDPDAAPASLLPEELRARPLEETEAWAEQCLPEWRVDGQMFCVIGFFDDFDEAGDSPECPEAAGFEPLVYIFPKAFPDERSCREYIEEELSSFREEGDVYPVTMGQWLHFYELDLEKLEEDYGHPELDKVMRRRKEERARVAAARTALEARERKDREFDAEAAPVAALEDGAPAGAAAAGGGGGGGGGVGGGGGGGGAAGAGAAVLSEESGAALRAALAEEGTRTQTLAERARLAGVAGLHHGPFGVAPATERPVVIAAPADFAERLARSEEPAGDE